MLEKNVVNPVMDAYIDVDDTISRFIDGSRVRYCVSQKLRRARVTIITLLVEAIPTAPTS